MKRKQNETIIYEAALEQFAQRGYKKTTLESIGASLDMTNANLYCYAPSKQSLYHDSVAYAMTKWQNKVYEAIRNISDPTEKLAVLCDSAVLYLSEDTVFCRILKNDPDIFPMFPTVDPYEEINKKSVALLKETIQNGVDSGAFSPVNTDSTARFLFALYKTIIIEGYVQSEDENFIEAYYELKNVVLRGLKK